MVMIQNYKVTSDMLHIAGIYTNEQYAQN